MYHAIEGPRFVTGDAVVTVCVAADSQMDSTVVFELRKQEPALPAAVVLRATGWGMEIGIA